MSQTYCETRSIHLYVISHASKIYVLTYPPPLLAHTDTQPIHHCELFDHLTKYSVART